MNRTSTRTSVDLRRMGLAAGASVVSSAAWYTAWGKQLARLNEVYAGDARPPAWLLPVELARSAAVAKGGAVLSRRSGVHGTGGAPPVGAGLWAAFPGRRLSRSGRCGERRVGAEGWNRGGAGR